MRTIFILSYLTIALCAVSQENYYELDKRWVTVQVPSGEIKCEILTKWSSSTSKGDMLIYWYDRGQIKKAQGAYSGYLLSGEYITYDKNSNLLEKGKLSSGKRIGRWYIWNSDGFIFEESKWKNGMRNGITIIREDSIIIVKKYDNHKLDGWVKTYDNKNNYLIKKERFRNNLSKKIKFYKKKEKKVSFLNRIAINNKILNQDKHRIKPHKSITYDLLKRLRISKTDKQH